MQNPSSPFQLTPIGTIRSCFQEKFGIPRQPRLVPASRAVLKFLDGADYRDALRGIEGFSHLWIVTVFHENGHFETGSWRPLVRPPRLGGARKMGVLASRSPHRPNPIGISAVELERVALDAPGGPELHLKGIDFLDGTPVLDVKPYIPYSDSIPEASLGWTRECEQSESDTVVEFTPEAIQTCTEIEREGYRDFAGLIRQVILQDPRPAFSRNAVPETYGCRLYDFDVRWKLEGHSVMVFEIEDLRAKGPR